MAVQPSILKESKPSEGMKKRFKTPAGRTDLPLVHQLKAMQAKTSSSPSQSSKPKPTVKPTRKSFRIATQSTQKPRKKGGSSKQSSPVIEEIVCSPKGSPLRDLEITPEEQGFPKTSAVSMGTTPAEPTSEPTLSALKNRFLEGR